MAVFSSQNTMNGHRSPNFDYISIVIAQLKPDQPVAQTLITRFGFSLSEKKSSFFDLKNSLFSFSDSIECWNEHLKSSLVHFDAFCILKWPFENFKNRKSKRLTLIQCFFKVSLLFGWAFLGFLDLFGCPRSGFPSKISNSPFVFEGSENLNQYQQSE